MDISILHLSDLHIINKNGNYSEILKNLIDDIYEQSLFSKHIVLVITGDIIDRAEYNEENINVAKKFFSDLHNKIGEKIAGVQISPGNHDKEHNEIIKSVIDNDRESGDIKNIEDKTWKYYLVQYSSYLDLANDIRCIFNKNSKKINNTYYIDTVDESDFKIIFINIDTSWSSYGGIGDKRKLCIDEGQLTKIKNEYQKEKRELNKKYITVMTAHHPLNWLKEKDEAYLSSWLLNTEYFNIDFYLCGHTHDRQIKSFFDTYKSYITLVTGIGWGERKADEEKDKHRYSIYNIDLNNNSCEIIIRKTCTDGNFDYDNDVLLSDEEKKDKRIYLPLHTFENRPKITIPIYRDNVIRKEYLFVDKEILETMNKITKVFYEVSNHMALFQAMHIRDFFDQYELHKKSNTTVSKLKIYDGYFYKGTEDAKAYALFDEIKNYNIIFNQYISFLRELCGTLVKELKEQFDSIEYIRFHFRKYFKAEDGRHLYIALCQAIENKNEKKPPIRDLEYEKSMLKIAFKNNMSLVYSHNKQLNPLTMDKTKYKNFISMAPSISRNIYNFKENRKDITRPFLTASLSITCNENNHLLDILNYMNVNEFVFRLVYDYASLFRIDMEKFIEIEEEDIK